MSDLLIPDPENDADIAARLVRWRDRAGEYASAALAFSDRLRAETWDHMAEKIVETVNNGVAVSV